MPFLTDQVLFLLVLVDLRRTGKPAMQQTLPARIIRHMYKRCRSPSRADGSCTVELWIIKVVMNMRVWTLRKDL